MARRSIPRFPGRCKASFQRGHDPRAPRRWSEAHLEVHPDEEGSAHPHASLLTRLKETNDMRDFLRGNSWRVSLFIGNNKPISIKPFPEKHESVLGRSTAIGLDVGGRLDNDAVTLNIPIHEFLVMEEEALPDFLGVPNRGINIVHNLSVCSNQNAMLFVHRGR